MSGPSTEEQARIAHIAQQLVQDAGEYGSIVSTYPLEHSPLELQELPSDGMLLLPAWLGEIDPDEAVAFWGAPARDKLSLLHPLQHDGDGCDLHIELSPISDWVKPSFSKRRHNTAAWARRIPIRSMVAPARVLDPAERVGVPC